MVKLAQQGQQGPPVIQVQQVHLEQRETLEPLEQQEAQVQLEQVVALEQLEMQVLQEGLEIQEPLVALVPVVELDLLAQQVQGD